ncbi:MAG: hypothetical protein KDA60_20835, partial [Planctomycetales bacterium]|nr:hypothetical protein [Planctomycetales bacterium]
MHSRTRFAIAIVMFACGQHVSSTHAQVLVPYTWVGPGIGLSGDWESASNWRERGGPPDTFGHWATIDAFGSPYVVSLNQNTQLGRLTFDSPDATLQASGLIGPDGRQVTVAPGGVLELLQGTLSGDLRFHVSSGAVTSTEQLLNVGSPIQVSVQGSSNFWNVDGPNAFGGVNETKLTLDGTNNAATLTLNNLDASGTFTIGEKGTIDVRVGDQSSASLLFPGASPSQFGALSNSGLINAGLPGANTGSVSLQFSLANRPGGHVHVYAPTTLLPILGTNAHSNSGTITLHNQSLSVTDAPGFVNTAAGVIDGTGQFSMLLNGVTNHGVISPGIEFFGNLVNTSTASWTFGFRGTPLDPKHDQLQVHGQLTLGGHLQIEFEDGYAPELLDSFPIIEATSVTGQFDSVQLPFVDPNQALVLSNTQTGVRLLVRAPNDRAFISTDASSSFHAASTWNSNNRLPNTDWRIEINNQSGTPQAVLIDQPTQIQGLTVAGGPAPGATMTLNVADGIEAHLTGLFDLRENGHLQLGDGSLLSTQGFTNDGGTVSGTGTVATNSFVNGGTLSPGGDGIGTITVDGDFLQGASGKIVIEVGGVEPGQYDVVHVAGQVDAQLGDFDLVFVDSGGGLFQPHYGDSFKILEGDNTLPFEDCYSNPASYDYCVGSTDSGIFARIVELSADFNG